MYRGWGTPVGDLDAVPDVGDIEDYEQASYSNQVVTLTAGPDEMQARILYDSHNRIAVAMGAGDQASGLVTHTWHTRAARAEGSKAVVYAVEGFMAFEPSTWSLGSMMRVGMRLGVWEQEAQSGYVLLPTAYSMFAAINVDLSPWGQPAMWANDRNWVWERRPMKYFGDASSTPLMIVPVRWRSRLGRALKPDECFAMVLEIPSQTGVSNLRTRCWLRSFVADEG